MKLNVKITRGALFLVLSIIGFLMMPSQIKVLAGEKITGRTFPTLLLTVILIASVSEIVMGFVTKNKTYFTIQVESLKRLIAPFSMLAIVLAYVLLIPRIGFLISSLLMGVGTLAFLRCKKWLYYVIVIIFVFAVYFLFIYGLRVSLPRLR